MSDTERVFLSIKVPKEIEPGPGPIAAEQIFSALHSIQEEIPWTKRLFGMRGARLSLEIINQKKHIRFLVTCERRYKNLIESQIYAHYPNVEIFEEADYIPAQLDSGAVFFSTELHFSNPDVFPIKRYPQFEDRMTRLSADPIAGITSALTKLNGPNDESWIHIVAVPMENRWRVKYLEILRIVHRGVFGNIEALQNMYMNVLSTRKVWPRVVFFPFYALFWLRRKMVGFGGMSQTSSSTSPSARDLEEVLSKSHDRESVNEACVDKIGKLLFEVNVRIGYVARGGDRNLAEHEIPPAYAGGLLQLKLRLPRIFLALQFDISAYDIFVRPNG